MTTATTLLQANLDRVFNERDATRRAQAIRELYAADAIFYEHEAMHTGTEAIAGAVTHLLGALPSTLMFSSTAPAMQNHGMGKLLWRGHLPDGTTVVTGTDIAQIDEGRIRSLHVFVDVPTAVDQAPRKIIVTPDAGHPPRSGGAALRHRDSKKEERWS